MAMLSINFAPFKAISSKIQPIKARQKCVKTEYRQIKEHKERYLFTNTLRHNKAFKGIRRQVKQNTVTNKMHEQERWSFTRRNKAPKVCEGVQKGNQGGMQVNIQVQTNTSKDLQKFRKPTELNRTW